MYDIYRVEGGTFFLNKFRCGSNSTLCPSETYPDSRESGCDTGMSQMSHMLASLYFEVVPRGSPTWRIPKRNQLSGAAGHSTRKFYRFGHGRCLVPSKKIVGGVQPCMAEC